MYLPRDVIITWYQLWIQVYSHKIHNFDFLSSRWYGTFPPAILAPLNVVALIAAVVSVVPIVSVFALVCVALCLQFCVTTPTDSFLTNLVLFHSL